MGVYNFGHSCVCHNYMTSEIITFLAGSFFSCSKLSFLVD